MTLPSVCISPSAINARLCEHKESQPEQSCEPRAAHGLHNSCRSPSGVVRSTTIVILTPRLPAQPVTYVSADVVAGRLFTVDCSRVSRTGEVERTWPAPHPSDADTGMSDVILQPACTAAGRCPCNVRVRHVPCGGHAGSGGCSSGRFMTGSLRVVSQYRQVWAVSGGGDGVSSHLDPPHRVESRELMSMIFSPGEAPSCLAALQCPPRAAVAVAASRCCP
jgi:hypothetical protein